ncbi:MAG: dephospho-CoA kinase [Clostridiales bacterium]|nr:dephospho-CoA kinase [Clostridiales bacterium]
MKLIGLAGGIASGKTMITEYLTGLGAPVVDADVISRRITEPGSPVLRDIAEAFGEDCLDEEGCLRRKELGRIIFGNPESRLRLNRIMHPRISERIQEEIRKYQDAGEPVILYSAPLLLEGGSKGMTDEVWLVALEPKEQIRRLMDRDGINEEEAAARLRAQSSLEEKLALADKVIDNNRSREEAMAQAKALWEEACGR